MLYRSPTLPEWSGLTIPGTQHLEICLQAEPPSPTYTAVLRCFRDSELVHSHSWPHFLPETTAPWTSGRLTAFDPHDAAPCCLEIYS